MKTTNHSHLSIVTEITLCYHPVVKPSQRPKVTSSTQAYDIFIKHWNHDKIYLSEQCYLMLLNVSGSVLGIIALSNGGICSTVIDLKLIFASALKACANSIILAHNHPSGAISPSSHDIEITKRIAEAGKILGITLADHLIVTPEEHFSFAEEGLL